ncbi:MAG: hypothetical protein IKV83_09780 [Muribaculaceae bacterium]|nr:hypothetical protein [Muribaculaceae bacterium]
MAKEEVARVRSVVEWLISNRVAKSQKGIAQLMGYNHCVLSQVLNGKTPVAEKFVRTLSGLDKRINAEWVLTGVGEMINEPEAPTENKIELPKVLSLSALTNLAEKRIDSSEVVKTIFEMLSEQIAEITLLRTEVEKLRSENEILRQNSYVNVSAAIASTFMP